MRPSGISSIESKSWKVEEWEDGQEIWFIYFLVLQPPQGGIHIKTRNGGGKIKKSVVRYLSEIWGVSWFTRIGGIGEWRGSG